MRLTAISAGLFCLLGLPNVGQAQSKEPSVTLANEFPEFAAAGAQSKYYAFSEFRDMQPYYLRAGQLWPEDKQPDWEGIFKDLPEMPGPDPKSSFSQVWRKNERELFIRYFTPPPSGDLDKDRGISTVYQIEPHQVKVVSGFGDWGKVAVEGSDELRAATPTTLIVVAMGIYEFNPAGQISQKTWYRSVQNWAIVGQKKWDYWPGGTKLKSISYVEYPENGASQDPEVNILDEFTEQAKPVPRAYPKRGEDWVELGLAKAGIAARAGSPGTFYLTMPKESANVYVFHYATYGEVGSTLAMQQECALAKIDPEEGLRIYKHFCYKTDEGVRSVDRRRQVVFTLDFADPSNEKEAEQLASKLGEALWPMYIVN